MQLKEVLFHDEQDAHKAAVIRGTMLEERGWRPTLPERMLIPMDQFAESLERFNAAGLRYEEAGTIGE